MFSFLEFVPDRSGFADRSAPEHLDCTFQSSVFRSHGSEALLSKAK